jgi:isopentenyl diphosphate isomerase/L-lactate dehydrogenase-like FMN-dependent dehydrogenase
MLMTDTRASLLQNRREFLLFIAASTVVAPATRAWAQQLVASHDVIPAAAKDFLQVMDFEEAARRVLPPAHWGYMATGVDDDLTLKANVEAYRHIGLKPRRLVDVSRADLSVDVFGVKWETPIFVCPVGGQQAFHAEGELATARAARAKRHQMILSSSTSTALEEVARAYGTAPWYQLYMPRAWSDTEKLVKRVEDAGCPVMAWTVDLLAGRNIPTATRFARQDTRNCIACHVDGPGVRIHGPMYQGLSASATNPPEATWAYVDRLKKLTRMKLLLKGLDSAEDARLAVEHGADGIIVSNHGGRATETLRATIDCLPEVVQAVNGRIPVFVDGGVRHGTDIYKALAAGARGVGIGRPYIWGLSAFGQEGAERVLEILRAELTLTMRQMGTPAIRDITAARLTRPATTT